MDYDFYLEEQIIIITRNKRNKMKIFGIDEATMDIIHLEDLVGEVSFGDIMKSIIIISMISHL
jgi:hypothetical protein